MKTSSQDPLLFVDVDGVISLYGFLLASIGCRVGCAAGRGRVCLTFGRAAVFGAAHWKLAAIEAHAGDRPAAWIDDSLDEKCRAWASSRSAPTLVVETDPAVGLTDRQVEHLVGWADALSG